MKKETIFKHEINESMQANAALNCLKNRNTPKKLNETSDFDARFEFRKDLRELASPIAKKAYMIIRKQYGDNMWRRLYMDDCDERGLIDMLNMYAERGLNPQQIVNKMMGVCEDEQEEITGDKAEYAMELVKKFENDVPKIYKSTPEIFMMQQLLKVIGWDISKKEYNEWWELLCDACEEVFGSGYREWYKYLLDAMEEQEELPQMERRDMILALAEDMSESWIDTGDDGDLDDIYYAIADILDRTGDYPASTDWEDCKPWCEKYYKEVEGKIY